MLDDGSLVTELEAMHGQCFGWAMLCCGRIREDAEDILHDCYLKALDGSARYEGRSSLRTWMFGVIRRTAASQRRRRRVRELLGIAGLLPVGSAGVASDEAIIDAERRDRILGAMAMLSARQREVLHLVFYQGMTIEEAAGVMGVAIGSARTHYQRGKERLALLLRGVPI